MRQVYKLLAFLIVGAILYYGLSMRDKKQTGILNKTIETPKTKVRGKKDHPNNKGTHLNHDHKRDHDQKAPKNIELSDDNEKAVVEAEVELKNLTKKILDDAELVHNPAPVFLEASVVIGAIQKRDKKTQEKFFRKCKDNPKINSSIRFVCMNRYNKLGL